MTRMAGGRWLARDREIGAATEEPVEPGRVTNPRGGDPATQPPQVFYPLMWRLDDQSIDALASVCEMTRFEFAKRYGGLC